MDVVSGTFVSAMAGAANPNVAASAETLRETNRVGLMSRRAPGKDYAIVK